MHLFKLGSILILLTAGSALASTIEYTFIGTGSGTVGAFSFFDVSVTVQVLGNTTGVVTEGPGVFINPGTTSVIIPGVGDVVVTDATQMFSNIESGIGIGDNTSDLAMFYLSPSGGYNLMTNYGPLFNATPGAADQFHGIGTADGILNMSLWENVTFTATLAPEPSTLSTFLLVGLAGLGIRLWLYRGAANQRRRRLSSGS